MKRVIWDKSALETVRSFSVEVRQEIGALLRILQDGGAARDAAIKTDETRRLVKENE